MIINAPKEKIGSKKNPTPWIMSKNARVLIVDDMDTNLIILKAILVKIGFTENFIDSAKNGKIGLAMVQNVSQSGEHNDYDLIITDYQMPVMDGIKNLLKLFFIIPD